MEAHTGLLVHLAAGLFSCVLTGGGGVGGGTRAPIDRVTLLPLGPDVRELEDSSRKKGTWLLLVTLRLEEVMKDGGRRSVASEGRGDGGLTTLL